MLLLRYYEMGGEDVKYGVSEAQKRSSCRNELNESCWESDEGWGVVVVADERPLCSLLPLNSFVAPCSDIFVVF